jgi:hypothetical protein
VAVPVVDPATVRSGDRGPNRPRRKAGKVDPMAFVARRQVADSDVPTTVQLIDEDLWQVPDKAPGPVVGGDQPTPAPRMRR